MSNINTTTIDPNYPVPGINNSTQGFRDNFSSIKTNLTAAKDEITDLQTKAIVKSALTDSSLNNDMAGQSISNVLTKGYRSSMYPIAAGTIPSTITVDVSKGDVQYGNIGANTYISFGGWSPSGTQSSVQLNLKINNPAAIINFGPSTVYNSSTVVTAGYKPSIELVENFSSNLEAGPGVIRTNQITAPEGVNELQLRFTTVDCGTTIDVTPVNRNQVASRIPLRTPTPTGMQGDSPGALCTDGDNLYVCFGTYDSSSSIWGYVALGLVT